MRLLTRIRNKDIPASFRGKTRQNRVFALLKQQRDLTCDKIEKLDIDSKWSPCKPQLLKESSQTCAYCESPTTIVSYGDVEHYRPKSKYWWLAYCYDNYLASCTLCNQKYKKAKFQIEGEQLEPPVVRCHDTDEVLKARSRDLTPDPLKNHEGQDMADFIADHQRERPRILNPYIDDPKDYISWEVDHTLETVRIVPLDANNGFQKRMVEACEEDYGINRKELLSQRYDKYLTYAMVRKGMASDDFPAPMKMIFEKKLQRLLKPEDGYHGMIQHFERMSLEDLPIP